MASRIDDVLDRLQTVGLSLYEARLYVGLLQGGSQNGNELSKTAAVPSSKVYSTLEKLRALGFVHQTRRDGGMVYTAIAPDDLVARLRSKFLPPLEFLESTLRELDEKRPEPETITISSIAAIYDHARRVISEAERDLYVSVWEDDLEEIRPALMAADSRGVRIFAMLYGERAELAVGSSQRHSYQDIVAGRIGGRMLTIAADRRGALIAHIPTGGIASGVRTSNPVLCLVTEEYLGHDFLLQGTKQITGLEAYDKWWHSDPRIRSIILGNAVKDPGVTASAPARKARKKASTRASRAT
jgi:HTH-type transcriptional regulator, sugar sensing transcriptional regulator